MKLGKYLHALLPERFDSKEDVEGNLKVATENGWTILITGEEQTGKTTLCRVLRKHGYRVIEADETIHIHLTKKIPTEQMITDYDQNIE